MQMVEKWSNRKTIKSMVKDIEYTFPNDTFDDTDDEEFTTELDMANMGGYYANMQAPQEPIYENVEDLGLPKQHSKTSTRSKKHHRPRK